VQQWEHTKGSSPIVYPSPVERLGAPRDRSRQARRRTTLAMRTRTCPRRMAAAKRARRARSRARAALGGPQGLRARGTMRCAHPVPSWAALKA